jgi:hypothetical protein
MIRVLYPTPGPVDFGRLVTELRAVNPTVISSNDVGGLVAIYTPGAHDETALGAVVAAHAGPQAPPADPLLLLAQAIVDATTIEDVKPTALAILGDVAP